MPANGFSWMRNARPCCCATRRIVAITIMLWSEPDGRRLEHRRHLELAGATSLWRVLAGMPSRHSSRSRSIMNARIRSRIEPKYWSSSSWPLGDGAPNSVRPVSSRSGRCSASRRSMRKYSCSGPIVVNTRRRVGVAEPAQDAQRLLAQRLLRAKERDLVVERLARERDVGGRDRHGHAVGLDLQEDRRRHVPRGVAAGLERRPDPARRERRRVRLALDQHPARELGDRVAVADRVQERVVLLGGGAGHRHEPVRVVGRTVLERPLLDAVRDGVGDDRIERLEAVDGPAQGLEDRLGEVLPLGRLVEHVLAVDGLAGVLREVRGGGDRGCCDGRDGLLTSGHVTPA